MSSNTENIEAKLCAYVDGDLDEQGKLEIEKHLQQNPQHRMLLQELKQTKTMMQGLPREAAPPELAETIHGQLERSVLLDGVGTDDVAATMKINRWPQLMAVAAVLFLATGLGILVYVVLPKHADTTIAFDPAPKPAESSERRGNGDKALSTELGAVGKTSEDGARFPEDRAPIEVAGKDEVALSKGMFKSEAKDRGEVGAGGGSTLTLDAAPANPILGKTGEAAVAALPARRVLIVLKTDNIAETNGQVCSYLDTNKIAWSPAAPAEREIVMASRFRDTNVQLRGNEGVLAANINGNATTNNTTAGVGNNAYNGGSGTENNGSGSKVATRLGNADDYARNNSYPMTQTQRQGGDVSQSQQQYGVPNQAPSQPAEQVSQTPTQAQAAPQPNLSLNQPAGKPAAGGLDRSFAFNDNDTSRQNVIVARNVSREQAVLMVDSIGKLYAGQTAVVLDRDVLDTVPVGQLKQVEDVLTVLTTQPGTTQPATTQPAATAAEGQQTWAEAPAVQMGEQSKPRKESPTTLPADAAPPVPELAVTPTTRQAEGVAVGGRVSQSYFNRQAADLDLKGQSTTRPAELPLEVVIVVQPAAAAGEVPPAGPATETPPNPGAQTEPVAATPPAPAAPTTQPGANEAVPPPAESPQAK